MSEPDRHVVLIVRAHERRTDDTAEEDISGRREMRNRVSDISDTGKEFPPRTRCDKFDSHVTALKFGGTWIQPPESGAEP